MTRMVVTPLALGLALCAAAACTSKKSEDKKAEEKPAQKLENGLTDEQQKQVLARLATRIHARRLRGAANDPVALPARALPEPGAAPRVPRQHGPLRAARARGEEARTRAAARGRPRAAPDDGAADDEGHVRRQRRQAVGHQRRRDHPAYYDANPGEFHKPAQRRASHILFKDKAKAEAVLKKLQAAPEDMELFRKLAEENTIDAETKTRFGDLRFFSLDVAEVRSRRPSPSVTPRSRSRSKATWRRRSSRPTRGSTS